MTKLCQEYCFSAGLHEAPCNSKSSYNAVQNCHAIAHVERMSSKFPEGGKSEKGKCNLVYEKHHQFLQKCLQTGNVLHIISQIKKEF